MKLGQKKHLRQSQGQQWWVPRVSAHQRRGLPRWRLFGCPLEEICALASPRYLASGMYSTSWFSPTALSSRRSAANRMAYRRSRTLRCSSLRHPLTAFSVSVYQSSSVTHEKAALTSSGGRSSSSRSLLPHPCRLTQPRSWAWSRSGSEICDCTRLDPASRLSWSAASTGRSELNGSPWLSSSLSRSRWTVWDTWRRCHANLCFSQPSRREAGIWSQREGWCCQHLHMSDLAHSAFSSSLNLWWCGTSTRWKNYYLLSGWRQFWATGSPCL